MRFWFAGEDAEEHSTWWGSMNRCFRLRQTEQRQDKFGLRVTCEPEMGSARWKMSDFIFKELQNIFWQKNGKVKLLF